MANIPVAPGGVGISIRVDGRASPRLLSQMVPRDKLENQGMATVTA